MDGTIAIILPVHPLIFAIFLAVCVVYLIYSIAKFIISLYTGA